MLPSNRSLDTALGLLVVGLVLIFIGLNIRAAELHRNRDTIWLTEVQPAAAKNTPAPAIGPDYQLGLRSDGVVVWRRR